VKEVIAMRRRKPDISLIVRRLTDARRKKWLGDLLRACLRAWATFFPPTSDLR